MTTKASDQEPQPDVEEAHITRKRGGWITFPFIAVSMLGVGISVTGATSNIIVYLIKEYNVKSIDAAQIANIINGCTSLAPLVGAIISDAYFGCYSVVAFSTIASLVAVILFTLTSALPSLRPSPCTPGSDACTSPSAGQLALLYTAAGLLAVGTGGTRFNTITLGAGQFDEDRDQVIFFNWYFIVLYSASVFGSTVIVYVQDSISWALGFGLCIIASAISVIFLLLGTRYYRWMAVQGSPFTCLARVAVAAIKKRKIVASSESLDYYYGSHVVARPSTVVTSSFSFLNRAAVISPDDTHPDGSLAKPWRLCSVQEVNDLKALLLLAPVWSSGILVSISIGIQASLTVLQALTMDRSLGPGRRFAIPAGSMMVAAIASTAFFLSFFDRVVLPLYRALTRRTPTHLQRLGLGHLLNLASMAVSALVERRRAAVVRAHHAEAQPGWIVPMSVLWLMLPLAIVGAGEAMHFPAQVALYYQEFPESLRSTATGMVALILALGFYLSTAVVDLVRRTTGWLPDNINGSRLENVYWLVTVLVAINFGYFLLCARLYKYQNVADKVENNANTRSLAH